MVARATRAHKWPVCDEARGTSDEVQNDPARPRISPHAWSKYTRKSRTGDAT
jgi:hypothetical protein